MDPERSAWCSCSEAQLCCATASGDDTSAGDDGTPAAPGDMSAGDDGTPADSGAI